MVAKSYIVGSGLASLGDVVHVASAALPVDIDASAAQRVKKESPAPKQFQAEDMPSDNSSDESASFPEDDIRAALFVKLNNLVNGKSKCRLAVAEQIRGMLNANVIPKVPVDTKTDKFAFSVLADAFHGVGVDLKDRHLQDALEEAGIESSSLSADERLILEDGMCLTSGIASLCVEKGKSQIAMATFVSALSAEVLKAEVKCFETDISETFPLKYSVDVAESLKNMFDGSTQVVTKKNNNVIAAIVDVPAVHGGVRYGMDALAAAAKASVTAVALPPHKSGSHRHYICPSISQDLLSLGYLLINASQMSLDRIHLIVEGLADETSLVQQVDAIEKLASGAQERINTCYQNAVTTESALRQAKKTDAGPSVVCAKTCKDSLNVFSESLCLEVLCGMLGLHSNKKSADSIVVQDKNANSKKKIPGFSIGRGTESFVQSIHAMLQSQDGEADFQGLNLEGIPSTLFDIDASYEKLTKLMDVYQPGFKNILDSVNRVLEANCAGRKPKIAKGARDFGPEQMAIREVAFQKIISVFKRHGAVSIDTPVFELRETLMGKYGEDSKLIYDLADQGGEILSLRYDLTVPFARHVAVHGITNIKRYHIAKVYRRDQPQMNRGRYREFFQCDFDIAGVYSPMVPDSEVLKVLVEILDDLSLGDYEIKINHRKLLDAMLDIAGVPAQKFRPICSAIDKLDKEPWEAVKREMVEEKGLPEHVADKIGDFVVLKGEPRQVLATLQAATHPLSSHPESAAALQEMKLLFDFLDVMGALRPFSFDLSLARGLDYYTGVIYEAVFKGGNVGSIAAGGRYDHLVGMFSGKEVPAVGVSIGIERVFAIMEAQMKEKTQEKGGTIRETETEVLVASIGNDLQPQRMKIASELWQAGIKCEFGFKPNPKMGDQLNYALKSGIPLVILFGEDEINSGQVKLKDLDAEVEEEISRTDIVRHVKEKLSTLGERRIVFKSN